MSRIMDDYEMCNKKYLTKNFRKILFKKDLTYYSFINKIKHSKATHFCIVYASMEASMDPLIYLHIQF